MPDPRWYATTCEEMHAFVTINILFGIKTLPETRLYWSKDSFLGVPSIQSCQEFDLTVRPLLDVISRTFSDEYRPPKFVSINETMVKYKGRLGFK